MDSVEILSNMLDGNSLPCGHKNVLGNLYCHYRKRKSGHIVVYYECRECKRAYDRKYYKNKKKRLAKEIR